MGDRPSDLKGDNEDQDNCFSLPSIIEDYMISPSVLTESKKRIHQMKNIPIIPIMMGIIRRNRNYHSYSESYESGTFPRDAARRSGSSILIKNLTSFPGSLVTSGPRHLKL